MLVDDVLARMMDDRSAESCRTLLGHSGPVYRVAFSPDRSLLLSCSEDTSSMLTFTGRISHLLCSTVVQPFIYEDQRHAAAWLTVD